MKYYKEIDNYVSWISYQNPYPGKFDKSLIEPPGNTYQTSREHLSTSQ